MQTIHISYASRGFTRRQFQCAWSALSPGRASKSVRYGPASLDAAFIEANRGLLRMPRGAGLWLWKPRIILDAMCKAAEGDAIIYTDSASLVLRDLELLTALCRNSPSGILCFPVGSDFPERSWTKRDAFVLMECEAAQFYDTPQIRASAMVFVNRPSTQAFVSTWLGLMRQARLASDAPSICGKPEFSEFKEHRHDQSVFSLLSKKHGISPHANLIDQFLVSHVAREPALIRLLPGLLHPRMHFNDRDCEKSAGFPMSPEGL